MTTKAASERGRLMALQRKKVQKDCAWCGKTFVGIKKRLYCHNACAMKAKRARKNEQRT